jgi:hypothetical protein
VQQPRLAVAEAQLPLVGLMRRMPPGSRFSQFNSVGPICDRLQALKAAIKEAGDCKLAIVDDLAHFVRDGLGKVTRGDLTLALGALKSIAGECHVAILVVWRLERTGRSTAKYLETFLPSAAMAWLVGNDPYSREQRWVVSLKNHFGPPCEPMAFHIADNRVVWDEPPSSVPADVMAAFVRRPSNLYIRSALDAIHRARNEFVSRGQKLFPPEAAATSGSDAPAVDGLVAQPSQESQDANAAEFDDRS